MTSEEISETDSVYKSPQRFYGEEKKNSVTVSEEKNIENISQKVKYPKIVFLIIVNEFCERFSYYGLRTILFIYLTNFIHLEQSSATAIYHAFTVLCYFAPVFGAILADGYLGLYRTILYVSIVYCIGEIILTLTSMIPLGAPNLVGPMIALIIIAAGTGGIKPCVSAFGGNQFQSSQAKYLETFFSIFYLSINIGSTIGTILTPIFRNDIKCFGNDCYPLAFGVPALFMLCSIGIFVIGTPFYNRNDEKSKNGKNVIGQTIGCFYAAIKNKIASKKSEKKEHWLDFADTKYSSEMISDVKAFYKVLIVFLPLPVFWALYDQQGSRWTAQAQQLNGRIGSFTIKPDQFQAINPVFIVFLVPLFDFVIYPLFSKINFLKKQLQRMSVGLIFAIVSFIIAAVLESQMQKASLALNPSNRIRILNLSPCNIDFHLNNIENKEGALFNIQSSKYLKNTPFNMPESLLDLVVKSNQTTFELNSICENQTIINNLILKSDNLPKTLVLYLENNQIKSTDFSYDITNQIIGNSEIKIALFRTGSFGKLYPSLYNKVIQYDSTKFTTSYLDISKSAKSSSSNLKNSNSSYLTVDYADYSLDVKNQTGDILLKTNFLLETCGRYTVLLFPNAFNDTILDYVFLTDIYPSGVSIFWQLIQIFVMTVGEVMFSISGISFAYSQAPAKMKSVLQALWCLTVAFGNLIVVIVAESKFVSNQVYEYVLFAGLLLLATIVFMVLAWFYKYTDHQEENDNEKSDTETEIKEKEGTPNIAYKYSTDSEIQLIQISALDPK